MASPSRDWSESVPDGEAAELEALAARLVALQRRRAEKNPLGRALHYRATGAPRARLEILGELPDWARVGIFAAPGRYDAVVRFSNGNGKPQKDGAPDARGLALKVFGVPGTKLIPGMESATTQDFLGILNSTMPLPTPREFVSLIEAAAGPPVLLIPKIVMLVGLFRAFPTIKRLLAGLSRPVPSLTEVTWHSPVPIRWGEMAVKTCFVPVSSPTPAAIVAEDDPARLSHDLAARLRAGDVIFELRVQPFVDATRTPIEDPTVEWLESVSPWVPVARLVLPKQDLDSDDGRRVAEQVEAMSFDPWHAPVEFRPLGAIMRARGVAYRESVKARGVGPEPVGV